MKVNMKNIIAIFFILFPIITSASFDRDLYYGLRNDAHIQELQEFLTEQNFYSSSITGSFFSLTLKAVKDFQIANAIFPAAGYFGPKSRAKANEILVSQGISGSSVTTEEGTTTQVMVPVPKTTDDVVSILMAQIALLQKQIEALQAQQQSLSTIQQQQTAQTQALQQIQQNTTPPPPSPLVPSAPLPSVPEIDKSAILIKIGGLSEPYPRDGILYGSHLFTISILDKSGNYIKNARIDISTSDKGHGVDIISKYADVTTNGNDWYTTFEFTPTIKTVTSGTMVYFLSGSLQNSIWIQPKVGAVIQDVANLNSVLDSSLTNIAAIGSFKILTVADGNVFTEWLSLESIEYASDVSDIGLRVEMPNNGIAFAKIGKFIPEVKLRIGIGYDDIVFLQASNPSTFPFGKHTITIKSISLVGQSSGRYRSVSGLPITFTFEVR